MSQLKKLGFRRFAVIFICCLLVTTSIVWASDIYINSTSITGTHLAYSDLTGSPTFTDFANHTDIPQTYPVANITNFPTFTDFAQLLPEAYQRKVENTFLLNSLQGLKINSNLLSVFSICFYGHC